AGDGVEGVRVAGGGQHVRGPGGWSADVCSCDRGGDGDVAAVGGNGAGVGVRGRDAVDGQVNVDGGDGAAGLVVDAGGDGAGAALGARAVQGLDLAGGGIGQGATRDGQDDARGSAAADATG